MSASDSEGPLAAMDRFLDVAVGEIGETAERLDRGAIADAVALVRASEAGGGRVHVMGIGKPEHVARYAASLLASTGTAASFLHGTETTHGSVGQTRPGDVVVAISNSGSTDELQRSVEALRAFGVQLIAVTRDADSPLARAADVLLQTRVSDEGGPLGLAPRASILAQTLVLAALSVAIQEARGFTREDYQRRHPAGALGEKSRS